MRLGESGRLPQHRAVVENDIDTHELLEGGKPYANPDDWADAELRVEDVAESGTVVIAGQRGLDFAEFFLGAITHQAAQNLKSLVVFTAGHEEARAFRNDKKGEQEKKRRSQFDPEHPAPGLVAPSEHLCGATDAASYEIIAQEGAKESGNDADLLNRGEHSAIFRW